MIKQTLWGTYLVAAMATTPFSGHAEPVDGPLLRLHWEADAAREGLQVVCGEVRNDGTRAAQHVRLLVEQLDGGGRVMASRALVVLGVVPADGRAYFCVPEPAGAATYRLSVMRAETMSTRGD
jgi:hypothetical protein